MSFRTLDEEVMEQALSESQRNFSNLWGQKLVNCLRAVHNVIYSDDNRMDSQEKGYKKTDELNVTNRKPDWLNDRFSNHDE